MSEKKEVKEGQSFFMIDREKFVLIFYVFSAINFLSSFLDFYNWFNLQSTQKELSFINSAALHFSIGVLQLFSASLAKKKKALVIWLYTLSILMTILYNLYFNYDFPYLTAIFGGFILSKLWDLKTNGHLK